MSTNVENTSDFSDTETKKQILLQTNNLSLRAGEQELLSGISLTVSTAEIVTIIGPNGAGKTTLLRAILGLIDPDYGSIFKQPKLRISYLP